VALLFLLLEVRSAAGVVLSIAHVNHQLRGHESDEDERFVADLSRTHDLELYSHSAPVGRDSGASTEAGARRMRYEFFDRLLRQNRVAKVATAHTLDDQAETVLLRLLRGTGIRGLAGIYPRLSLGDAEPETERRFRGEVIRPLLEYRRSELQQFLRQRAQSWREDSSNLELRFLGNRVRRRLMPVMGENFGDAWITNLADLAEIARAEEEHWRDHPEVEALTQSLEIARLESLPLAARRRLIRRWLETQAENAGISFRLIEEVLDLAASTADKTLQLPAGHLIRRTRDRLGIEPAQPSSRRPNYEYTLSVPGEVVLPELGIRLLASLVGQSGVPEAERDSLLDADRLPSQLTIRNWRPGDRFWPVHTKDARKVKELLNDRQIVSTQKRLWPVIVSGGDLIWVRGFPVAHKFRCPEHATRALVIRETPAESRLLAFSPRAGT